MFSICMVRCARLFHVHATQCVFCTSYWLGAKWYCAGRGGRLGCSQPPAKNFNYGPEGSETKTETIGYRDLDRDPKPETGKTGLKTYNAAVYMQPTSLVDTIAAITHMNLKSHNKPAPVWCIRVLHVIGSSKANFDIGILRTRALQAAVSLLDHMVWRLYSVYGCVHIAM